MTKILPIFGIVLLSIAGSSQSNVLAQDITIPTPTSNLNGAPLMTTVPTASSPIRSCPKCPTPGANDPPVCGTDGKTYRSYCLLTTASCGSTKAGKGAINLRYRGPCKVPPACPRCPAPFANDPPFCGTDGKTYDSFCLLNMASCDSTQAGKGAISVLYEGTCKVTPSSSPPIRSCPKCPVLGAYLPVCGTNGKTYNSLCLLDAASCESTQAGKGAISVLYEGFCKVTSSPRSCPFCPPPGPSDPPLCGSDGKTYSSYCLLTTASCESTKAGKGAISVLYEGPCIQSTPSPTPSRAVCNPFTCSPGTDPVCGTDGKTYEGACLLMNASCESTKAGKGAINLLHKGPCKESIPSPFPPMPPANCERPCNKMYAPVCGNDGRTHSNSCVFGIAKCKNATLSIVSQGACKCEDRGCNAMYAPVCGNDGRTYGNSCIFGTAKCKNATLSIVSNGKCGQYSTSLPLPTLVL